MIKIIKKILGLNKCNCGETSVANDGNDEKIIGYYHSADLDGLCSGAIMRKKFPNIELIGWNYGDELPYHENCKIIMSDISFPMEHMWLLGEKNNLTWIDHHISAQNDLQKYSENITIPFDFLVTTSKSACELTWIYFFNDLPLPRAVEMLGIYDSWRGAKDENWQTEVIPFQIAMRNAIRTVDDFTESYLTQDDEMIANHIVAGAFLKEYQDGQNASACKRAAFEQEFEGYRAICMNTSIFSSTVFDSVYDESKHDIMIPFQYNGKEWKFSLYSTKVDVDCSIIAKKYGGGGHKGASGFSVSDLKQIIK